MSSEWMDKLQSSLRPKRRESWNELRLNITRAQVVLSWKERRQLMQIYRQEEDPDVKQAARETLLELAVACLQPLPEGPYGKKQDDLAKWLWSSFKSRSAVVNVTDPRQLLRDESTLFLIGRILGLSEYPDVQGHSVKLYEPHWQQLLKLQPASLCLIGRLGLYGPEALQWWSPADPRYSFLMHERPSHLNPGDLDHDYHCIREVLPNGREKFYRTRDEGNRRTDYCLVMRYVVTYGVQDIVIVNCAGPTALGTLGAVTWAASMLPLPTRPEGEPIPAPKKLRFKSRLEALLEVTAEITSGAWSPNPGKLISLRVDDQVWNEADGEWRPEPPSQIRLVLQDGNPDRPLEIHLDGKEAKMAHGHQAFRLLARLAWKWRTPPADGIPIKELAADPYIGDKGPLGDRAIRSRLTQVKSRYLHDALIVTDSTVSLRTEVVVENSDGFSRGSAAAAVPAAVVSGAAKGKKATSRRASSKTRTPKRPR